MFNVNAMQVFGIADSGVVGQVLTGLIASGGSNYVHNRLRSAGEFTFEEIIDDEDEEEDDTTE